MTEPTIYLPAEIRRRRDMLMSSSYGRRADKYNPEASFLLREGIDSLLARIEKLEVSLGTLIPTRPTDVPVHMCPPGNSNTAPCCGRNLHELLGHRVTTDPKLVTCNGWRPPMCECGHAEPRHWAGPRPDYEHEMWCYEFVASGDLCPCTEFRPYAVCECGHQVQLHHRGRNSCLHSTPTETWACDCSEFRQVTS